MVVDRSYLRDRKAERKITPPPLPPPEYFKPNRKEPIDESWMDRHESYTVTDTTLKDSYYKKSKEPYWKGSILFTWPRRLSDFINQNFRWNPILVVRWRKDGRQDHRKIVIDEKKYGTFNWDNETYDILQNCIIRDYGNPVLYYVQGIRTPLNPYIWYSVADRMAAVRTRELNDDELEKIGRPTFDAYSHFTNMNNRDAEKIALASQSEELHRMFLMQIGVIVLMAIVAAVVLGLLPWGINGTLNNMLEGMKQIYNIVSTNPGGVTVVR